MNAPWYVSNRRIHEDLDITNFADSIKALTESCDSKLADAGKISSATLKALDPSKGRLKQPTAAWVVVQELMFLVGLVTLSKQSLSWYLAFEEIFRRCHYDYGSCLHLKHMMALSSHGGEDVDVPLLGCNAVRTYSREYARRL
jgi:hypothetical protein